MIYEQLLKCMLTYHLYANMVDFRIALVLLLLEKIPYYYNSEGRRFIPMRTKIRLAAKAKVNT